MKRRARCWGWIGVTLAVVVAGPAPAAGPEPEAIAVSVQARLGGDADRDGITDGSATPESAGDGHLRLVLRTSGPACENGQRPAWRIGGRPVTGSWLGPCELLTTVPGEGEYAVEVEGGGQTLERRVRVTEHLIVSIGDSVASGEGNPDRRADLERARWLQRPCHRSLRSGHAQAALAIERADRLSSVTLLPLGCSGATIPRGLLGPYVGIEPDRSREPQPPQVDVVNALAARRDIDALVVSVGANDIHFGAIVQFCAAVSNCPQRRFDPATPGKEARSPDAPTLDEVVTAALERLPDRYAQLDGALSAKIPRERVLLVHYFDPTRGRDGAFCKTSLGTGQITADESGWAAERVLGRLNTAISAAAQQHGWRVVSGVAAAFSGHGICAGLGLRWVRTPAESFFRQDAAPAFASVAGTLHPNGRGHLGTAALIRPQLVSVLAAAQSDADPEPGSGHDDEDEILGMRTLYVVIGGAVLAALIASGVIVLIVRRRRARRRTRRAMT